ncbi:MAG: hypothetical protein JST00_17070 [Deltaproteobacteria bacterium]|nr:hypothetical protein [Deltaproteobacteria bacterium]
MVDGKEIGSFPNKAALERGQAFDLGEDDARDGTLLIEDMTSFEGGTIFRHNRQFGKLSDYIERWRGDNQ